MQSSNIYVDIDDSMNLSDISLIYNMSISGVRKKIQRGLVKLKQYYDYNTLGKRF